MAEYSTILVTTDFSEQSLPGVKAAADLARRLDAEVSVLHVVQNPLPPIVPFASERDLERILESYQKHAAEKLETFAGEHLDGWVVETAVTVGVPSEEIVRFAEKRGVDLIVMASRGYGPLRQVALGSTTERVLHHAPCPVLVVRSK